MKYIVQLKSSRWFIVTHAYTYDYVKDANDAARFDTATQASAFIVNHALEGKASVMMLDTKGGVGPLL